MSAQDSSMALTSPAFDDGGRIPREYGRDQRDVNPPLRFEGVPEAAESLALLVEDPDAEAVAGKVWTHWLVYDIPPTRREVPEGWEPEAASQGRTDFDETAYGGPSPPSGEHTYVFTLYALDESPDLFDTPTSEDLQRSIAGSVLAAAELRGRIPPSGERPTAAHRPEPSCHRIGSPFSPVVVQVEQAAVATGRWPWVVGALAAVGLFCSVALGQARWNVSSKRAPPASLLVTSMVPS